MFEDVIFRNLWLVIPIWLLVSFLDHYFTFLAAREYKAGGKEHFLVEGSLELSPFHQKDVDAGRLYSPRALLVESIAIAVIVAFWIGWRTSKDPGALAFMQFLIGGFIVVRLRIASGNARMFFTLRSNRRHEGISGQTQYRRWRVYRDAATGDFLLSGVFFGLFLFTGSPSLLGGSFWAVAAGRADLGTSRKLKLAAEAGPPALAAGGVLEAPKEPRFAEWSMERDRKEREVPRSVLGARLYARFFSVQVVPAILGIACFGLCFRGVSRLVLPRTSGMDPAFLLACLGILLLACAFRANYASLMVPHKTLAVLLGIVVTSYFFFFVIGLPLLVFLLRIDVLSYSPSSRPKRGLNKIDSQDGCRNVRSP
jgi:hypothetical protein